MSKGVKLLLGVGTLWPLLYLGLFVGWWLSVMFRMWSGHPWGPPQEPPLGMGLVLGLHCLTMVWVAGLLVVYIVDVFRNAHVQDEQRALWAVVLFLGNVFAMPVYWSLHIWPERAAGAQAPSDG